MPDSVIVGSERKAVRAEETVLDRLPVWVRFPAVMATISCVMVLAVSIFGHNIWPLLVPLFGLYGLVAFSNWVALRFNINANKR